MGSLSLIPMCDIKVIPLFSNIVNRDVHKKEHPEAIRPVLPEIHELAKHSHLNVLHSILRFVTTYSFVDAAVAKHSPIRRLLALGMNLPEETFVDLHGFDAVGETYGKFHYTVPASRCSSRQQSGS